MDTNMPSHHEQRLVLRLLNYWRDLAGGRAMPTLAEITSGEILDDAFILELVDSGELAFRFIGERQKAVIGSDPAGLLLSTVDEETLLGRAVSYRAQVFNRGTPVSVGGQFQDKGGNTILYRSILLPLGENEIVGLLGCVNSRVVVLE